MNSTKKQEKDINIGLQRLISNNQMGSVFKCLVVSNHKFMNKKNNNKYFKINNLKNQNIEYGFFSRLRMAFLKNQYTSH